MKEKRIGRRGKGRKKRRGIMTVGRTFSFDRFIDRSHSLLK
jgi:hypothetical protein